MRPDFFFIKHQLREALLALRAELMELPAPDPHPVSLSPMLEQWLNTQGLKNWGHLPGIHDLARAHEEFGLRLDQAHRLLRASQSESAKRLCQKAQIDIKRLSMMLEKLEHNLQAEIENL